MIRTLEDLCEDYGKLNRYQLYRYADGDYRREHCYSEVPLQKRGGGIRILHVPEPKLKKLQSYLMSLFATAELAEPAAAYRKGRGLCDHAQKHVGAAMLVKLDIKDFFGSVDFSNVLHAVDRALSHSLLAGPHCREYGANNPAALHYNNQLSWYIAQFCTLEGALPQGAPTSPMLSNMVFLAMDRQITAYCQQRNIVYTRYSDDMIFSGDFAPSGLIRFIGRLLSENGYCLNEGKTVIAGKGKQKKVTGVVVNERSQVDRKYRQAIRQEVYYIGKFGMESHLSRTGEPQERNDLQGQGKIQGSSDLSRGTAASGPAKKAQAVQKLRSLMGRIQFVLQIDPGNVEFRQYKWECELLFASMTGFEE